jgi:hypothetical protein
MDQVTVSKEEDVTEPTYHQGSNPTGTAIWTEFKNIPHLLATN